MSDCPEQGALRGRAGRSVTARPGSRAWRAEALERRAAGAQGAVRDVLLARGQALREAEREAASGLPAGTEQGAALAGRIALSALLADLPAKQGLGDADVRDPSGATVTAARASLPADPIPPGQGATLPALRAIRGTWARLRAETQLRQLLAEVPDDAGPMHSTVLVHRAIAVMHEAAPGYLEHFVAYADALAGLERISPIPATTPAPRSPRPPRPSSPANASGPGKAPRPRSRGRRRSA
jgi:hypothetical protein